MAKAEGAVHQKRFFLYADIFFKCFVVIQVIMRDIAKKPPAKCSPVIRAGEWHGCCIP
jgi:hypothetical protein